MPAPLQGDPIAATRTIPGTLARALEPGEIVGTIGNGETKTLSAPASTKIIYRPLEATLAVGDPATFSISVPTGLSARMRQECR